MSARIMRNAQAGATLMEALIAMSISLVVTASMIGLMSNSLGSTARIIQMTKLSDDLRVTMQMISRDLRRASYNAEALSSCYGNENCANSAILADDVDLAGECFSFRLDRDEYDPDKTNGWGDSTDDTPGAFRRTEVDIDFDRDGEPETPVGVIEMWTGTTQAFWGDPDGPCSAANPPNDWIAITNPESMNISGFSVDEVLSYEQVIRDDNNTPIIKQKVRKIRVNLVGSLVKYPTITRQIEDIINVRNDLLFEEPQPGP